MKIIIDYFLDSMFVAIKCLLIILLSCLGNLVCSNISVYAQNIKASEGNYILLTIDKTFKEQIEAAKVNTYIEIRNDFDLEGKTVRVPEGCILNFKGGSIGNGELLLSKTTSYNYNPPFIEAGPYQIFKDKLIITGEFTSDRISIEWFGAVGNGVTDCTDAFRRALKMCTGKFVHKNSKGQNTIEYGKGYTIYLNNNRTYLVSGTINYYDDKYHNVNNVAFVGDKFSGSEAYPALGNKPGCIFLKKSDISLFAQANINSLTMENISITGEWIDWVRSNVKIFDDCLIRVLF